jgi:RNA 2',3'-cyclic 3'-phosphodiesterase
VHAAESKSEPQTERHPQGVRCFLALPLAEPALGEAGRRQEQLCARIPDVRWARPATLHVTVHFFGEVDEATVAAALAAVTPVVASTAAFAMTLDQLGSFPAGGTPRVIWLGPSELDPSLSLFAGACHDALRDTGLAIEGRPYRPHCTLGRPRRGFSEHAAWRSALAEPQESMRWTASRMVLFDSRSAPGGAVYTEQASLPFAAR